ncbi:hypothetical protein PL11_008165 [Lentilactobacillus curieae]|uniref:Uncharacterized protein n=1 Tax=Lentilactobacillus curieae TaxID=1138822 RepID=A0A1S6QJX2_9LACO|nr:hypothetical protein [Lentilactobacillus curieae]AQW21889.1 hypothetical protein PL11_008165 [Lentilactobacillus curieae]
MNLDIKSISYEAFKILGPVLIWFFFAGIPVHQYVSNINLLTLIGFAVFYSFIISQMFVAKPNLLIVLVVDIVAILLLIKLVSSLELFNTILIIIGLVLAHALMFTDLIDEPHCAWIIYSLISGTGVVFALMIASNHFISIIDLVTLTLLIFMNALFAFPLFLRQPHWPFTLAIAIIAIIFAINIIPSAMRIVGFIVLTGLFLFLQFSIKSNKYQQKADIATALSLLCAIVLFA